EEDFAATCRVAREVGFCKLHVFSYSPREGTSAASFKECVPPEVIHERLLRLQELERELAREYAQSLFGTELDVMVEGNDSARQGRVLGTSCRYVPVSLSGRSRDLTGHRVRVRAKVWEDPMILGDAESTPASYDGGKAGFGMVPLPLAV